MTKNKGKVLVVDDEEALQRILSFHIQREGFEVFTASNGEEALELIRIHQVNIIICDIRMPKMNGLEFVDELKKQGHERTPTVFVTGYAGISMEEAYAKGVEAIFYKPINYKSLMSLITTIWIEMLHPGEARDVRVEVQLKIELEQAGSVYAGRASAKNLSHGGIFVALDQQLPNVGDRLMFQLSLEYGKRESIIEGEAEVRWCRENDSVYGVKGVGLMFTYLADDAKATLFNFLNEMKINVEENEKNKQAS